ncbi:hypothetical protein GWK47_035881 [Chionoecetes opilio]|uniref:Uncharacterized protein n=1 Tax=Chionoecetes opilio TaxID=41210 RepID=A0A8J4YGB9_CHIOP|nr:hypothetical protein GWK47_035881 [Chionoecetes opilio]
MLLPGPTACTAATLPPARDDRSCGNPRGCLREPGQCRAEQPAWTVTSAPATVVTVSTQRATRCPDTLLLPAGPTPCFLSHSYRVVLWWTPAGQSAISISGDRARCGSRGGQLYHYYRKYGTQWDTNKKPPMKHHLFAYAACP